MPSRKVRLTRIANILMPILLTMIGSIAVLEIGLRQLYQLIPLEVCARDFIIGNYVCQPYFQYDNPIEIAYRYEPGLKIEGYWDPANPYLSDVGAETRPSERSDPFWYVLETDEMGFPNSQFEWQDAYDIVVTGDSFTVRSAPQTWIELLAQQTGKDILTLGAPSWTTLNEVAAVEKFGLDKNPDWVVLMYFEGNDLINVQQYLEKQASGLSWKAYDMQDVAWYERLVTFHFVGYLWDKIGGEDESADPVRYRYPVAVDTSKEKIDTVLKDIHLLPLSVDYATLEQSNEWAAVQDALLRLKQQVEAQGSNFLFVYIPSKEHVYWSRIWDEIDVNNVLERTVTVTLDENGSLAWEPQYLSYDRFNAIYRDQMRLVEDFATQNDFHFLNLTPIFFSQLLEQGELFHYADPHWNQAGNQLVADEIERYLNEND